MAAAISTSLCSSASVFLKKSYIPSSDNPFSHSLNINKNGISAMKFPASETSTSSSSRLTQSPDFDLQNIKTLGKIHEIHCIEEYDRALQLSGKKLVVAHFSATQFKYNKRIHEFLEKQSKEYFNGFDYLSIMADKSDETEELCRREKIEKIPHFVFYKNRERIHEVSGFKQEKLITNLLYHCDNHFSPIIQLHGRKDLEKLLEFHSHDQKLIVLNVGMKYCNPCVKIYPSVVKLASQMVDRVIFARMNGDENDSCMQILREMNILKVPSFLFVKNGELCGRYVGSCTIKLIKEIVKFRSDNSSRGDSIKSFKGSSLEMIN